MPAVFQDQKGTRAPECSEQGGLRVRAELSLLRQQLRVPAWDAEGGLRARTGNSQDSVGKRLGLPGGVREGFLEEASLNKKLLEKKQLPGNLR